MRLRPLLPLALSLLAGSCGDPTGPRPLSEYRLAVLRPDEGGTYDIFLMGLDGSGAVNLTRTPGQHELHPSWSPDGRRLAFVRPHDHTPGTANHELWTMRADGSGVTQLTFPEEHRGERVAKPEWSPDGRTIAHLRGGRLYLMDADGSNPRPVDAGVETVVWLSWAPDGRRLAIEYMNAAGHFQIATVRADGTGLRVLSPPTLHDGWPAWSPDGKRIAFSSSASRADDERWELLVMNADGSGRVRAAPAAAGHQIAPSWSPDGHWIAYVRFDPAASHREGLVVRADGNDPAPRTLGTALWGPIAWKP